MANAKKCDRCGKLYEPYRMVDCKMMPTSYNGHRVDAVCFCGDKIIGATMDLCHGCMLDLMFWFRNSQTDDMRAQTIKALQRIAAKVGPFPCLGCECEDGCDLNGCAIIGDAIQLLSVPSLDTSSQATDSLEQSTEVDDGQGN